MLFPHRINLPIRTYFNLSRVITWDNFNLPLSFIRTVKMSWRQQTDKLGSSFCLHLFSKGFFFNEMKSQFAWDILNSSRCHSNVLYLVIVTTLDFVGSGWEHFIQKCFYDGSCLFHNWPVWSLLQEIMVCCLGGKGSLRSGVCGFTHHVSTPGHVVPCQLKECRLSDTRQRRFLLGVTLEKWC